MFEMKSLAAKKKCKANKTKSPCLTIWGKELKQTPSSTQRNSLGFHIRESFVEFQNQSPSHISHTDFAI